MVDAFLIIVTLVTFILLLVIGLYLLVYYQHPDDKNTAWSPKVVVLLGFVLAGATVLTLPLDVANNEGYAGCDGYDTQFCGGLDMELFWNIIYWSIPIFMFLLIPFATFYYEADDGMLMAGTSVGANPNSRICEALKYQLALTVIVSLIFIVSFFILSDTDIPIQQYQGPQFGAFYTIQPNTNNLNFTSSQLQPIGAQDSVKLNENIQDPNMGSIVVQVTPGTFFAGLLAFVGWFFFALFGGIGLAAMPLDLIRAYINRPRHMDAVEFAEAQMSIRERVNELVDIGELMKIEREEKEQSTAASSSSSSSFASTFFSGDKRKAAREERRTFLQFKAAVYLLEQDVEDFQNCSANYANYNPLLPYISLLLGIISSIVSFFWVLHIILYVLPSKPITPFLNNYFQWFESWFPLFGTLSIALFCIYLLLCAVKGCLKFGLRFLWFQIHPMKPSRTYMSSLMFNIGLVLLCSLPVVQFSSTAFGDYARYSTVRQVFGTQIEYMQFFRFFWTNNVFVYALLCVTVLTFLFLVCKRKDASSTSSLELRDRLKSRRA